MLPDHVVGRPPPAGEAIGAFVAFRRRVVRRSLGLGCAPSRAFARCGLTPNKASGHRSMSNTRCCRARSPGSCPNCRSDHVTDLIPQFCQTAADARSTRDFREGQRSPILRAPCPGRLVCAHRPHLECRYGPIGQETTIRRLGRVQRGPAASTESERRRTRFPGVGATSARHGQLGVPLRQQHV